MMLADTLAAEVLKAGAGRGFERVGDVPAADARGAGLRASAARAGTAAIDFDVPLLAGDHVTDDAGTGFVHTAPGHGREDFDVWIANARELAARGIDTAIPYTVDADGVFTEHAPGFAGKRVITDKGEKGDANEAVIEALIEAGMLIARGRLKHQYPHSWRSKKPVIFRNTPQWFIAMDKPHRRHAAATRCATARSQAIEATRWVPPAGREPHHRHDREPARLGDLAPARLGRADRRLRARERRRLGRDPAGRARSTQRIAEAFEQRGRRRLVSRPARASASSASLANAADWSKVDDILDVWFDSGSTHAFALEDPSISRPRRHQAQDDGGPTP